MYKNCSVESQDGSTSSQVKGDTVSRSAAVGELDVQVEMVDNIVSTRSGEVR